MAADPSASATSSSTESSLWLVGVAFSPFSLMLSAGELIWALGSFNHHLSVPAFEL